MPISDMDIELLEAHLDGELSSSEDAALRDRLLSDQKLATELMALRADRAVRTEVFESLEPDDMAVKRLVLGVRKQITKEAVRGDRMRILRYIGSAAAVILFSFSAGWLGKARVANQAPSGQPAQVAVQNENSGSIDFTGNQGIGTLVSNTLGTQNAVRRPGENPAGYQVALTDALGRIVAVQHFNTSEEAREFSEDVSRWQRQQQQIRGAEPVVYKDRF